MAACFASLSLSPSIEPERSSTTATFAGGRGLASVVAASGAVSVTIRWRWLPPSARTRFRSSRTFIASSRAPPCSAPLTGETQLGAGSDASAGARSCVSSDLAPFGCSLAGLRQAPEGADLGWPPGDDHSCWRQHVVTTAHNALDNRPDDY